MTSIDNLVKTLLVNKIKAGFFEDATSILMSIEQDACRIDPDNKRFIAEIFEAAGDSENPKAVLFIQSAIAHFGTEDTIHLLPNPETCRSDTVAAYIIQVLLAEAYNKGSSDRISNDEFIKKYNLTKPKENATALERDRFELQHLTAFKLAKSSDAQFSFSKELSSLWTLFKQYGLDTFMQIAGAGRNDRLTFDEASNLWALFKKDGYHKVADYLIQDFSQTELASFVDKLTAFLGAEQDASTQPIQDRIAYLFAYKEKLLEVAAHQDNFDIFNQIAMIDMHVQLANLVQQVKAGSFAYAQSILQAMNISEPDFLSKNYPIKYLVRKLLESVASSEHPAALAFIKAILERFGSQNSIDLLPEPMLCASEATARFIIKIGLSHIVKNEGSKLIDERAADLLMERYNVNKPGKEATALEHARFELSYLVLFELIKFDHSAAEKLSQFRGLLEQDGYHKAANILDGCLGNYACTKTPVILGVGYQQVQPTSRESSATNNTASLRPI